MSKNGKFIKGGIIGAIIGATVGVLFAPKSGKETRKDIANAASKAKAESEKKLKELYQDLGEKSDEAKEMAQKLTGKAKTELNDLSKKAKFVQSKVKETISGLRDGEVPEEEIDKTLKEGKDISTKIKNKFKK